MKRILTFVALLLGSHVLASPAQDIFDEVSYYLVLNYGGAATVDVRTLPDKYQIQLEAACMNMANTCPVERAYPVITAMLAELQDTHTGFYPRLGDQVRVLLAGNTSQVSVGARVDILENLVFVRSVVANSPAAQAGLQRADQIIRINFRPINPKTFWANWNELDTQGGYVLVQRQGQTFRMRLQPSKLEAELPSLNIRADGIAVLKIPDFFGRGQGSIANQVHKLLSSLKSPKGLILELRDNPGGFVADCTGITAAFLGRAENRFIARTAFGSVEFFLKDNKIWQRRGGVESTIINLISPTVYTGKMVTLQNSSSASCSEFLASNLQEAGRSRVLGEISAGVANTSTSVFILSDNSVLQLSLNTRVNSSNQAFAATVQPNEVIADDLKAINSTGQDAILERAVAILTAP